MKNNRHCILSVSYNNNLCNFIVYNKLIQKNNIFKIYCINNKEIIHYVRVDLYLFK